MLLACLTGCVRAYHPLSGLHDPRIVDPLAPNFTDLSLTLQCVPDARKSLRARDEANLLCSKLLRVFENQGATVILRDAYGGDELDYAFTAEDEAPADEVPEVTSDLVMELRPKRIEIRFPPFAWLFCIASGTLFPGPEKQVFALELTIRDSNGFLLAEDTLTGRMVSRFGLGPWLGNAIANLGRPRTERLNNEQTAADLSNDLYGQLSQRLFDAKLRRRVLQESPAAATAGGAAP